MRVEPIAGALGAEIGDIDLGTALGPATVAAIRRASLLDFLFRHQVRPEFTCRFRWRPGSLAFWDNRATQHNPINDYMDIVASCIESLWPAIGRTDP